MELKFSSQGDFGDFCGNYWDFHGREEYLFQTSSSRHLPRTSRGCLKLGPTQRKAKLREVVGQILKDHLRGTTMGAQWLKICLPMQGNPGSIPGQGHRILQTVGQLSPHAKNSSALERWNPCATTREPLHSGACAPELERNPRTTAKDPACRNKDLTYCI